MLRASAALVFTAIVAESAAAGAARGTELLGYLENWVDVKWWDNNMPGNCVQGCFDPKAFLSAAAPYSALNYGFVFLTTQPSPDQTACSASATAMASGAGPCPVWDGKNIYLSAAGKTGSHAVDATTAIEDTTPGIVAIADVVRMARMHPAGPKRVKITLGGWSDFARMATVSNGQAAARLMAKLCAFTFSDGVDIDMEHLTPFSKMSGDDEFAALAAFVATLRTELDKVAANWTATADARRAAVEAQYAKLEDWQKAQSAPFYNTTANYLREVAQFGAPHLEISWTTRFNAFVPSNNPWNYLLPDSPRPNTTFETDNEGASIWPESGKYIDTVNVMAYDAGTAAGGLKLDFAKILNNFVQLGKVPAAKINMGFEPGEQAAGGVWEGQAADEAAARAVKAGGYGGCMVWAANPSQTTNPKGATLCPQVAESLANILTPTYAWGPPAAWTKCDPDTGRWPGL